jgi:hypothetical protein
MVEEGVVVLLLEGIGAWRDDDGARARGSPRRQWRLGAPLWLGEGEREDTRGREWVDEIWTTAGILFKALGSWPRRQVARGGDGLRLSDTRCSECLIGDR